MKKKARDGAGSGYMGTASRAQTHVAEEGRRREWGVQEG